jgi:carboxymethylenebutenolidase
MYETDMYEGMLAETVAIQGANGDSINAYYARPLGPGPYPAMVVIHHMPGWDEWYREATRKFAHHGYLALSPNLYARAGHGAPDDVAGAMDYLRSQAYCNGKVGVFGTCSGGRHAYLAACRAPGFDAVVDCWGGRVVMKPEELNEKAPVAPLDYTPELPCPIIGVFGNDDHSPTPEDVNVLEAELKKYHKEYEFYRYDGAGHGFFYWDRAAYRQEQAVDAWQKIFAFLDKNLSS